MTTTVTPSWTAALAGVVGAALALVAVLAEPAEVGIAVLIAGALLVPVRVAWGGSVPVGSAVLVAAAALIPLTEAAATLAAGVALGAVFLLCRGAGRDAMPPSLRYAGSAAGAIGGALAAELLVDGAAPTLAAALLASLGFATGDIVVGSLVGRPIALRSSLPVYLTLACAGILIAVAVDEVGVAMAGVAAFPLLITRFSFERYANATATLDQTVQALGLVPELAGLAPLGHSERAAVYAAALARDVGLDTRTTARVITATRLHHLGAVPFDADDDSDADMPPGEIATQGARIVREAGLDPAIADLLEAAKADTLDTIATSLDAAVVRVASTFDEVVGDDVTAADRGLALVSSAARDPYSRRVVAALLALAAKGDGLVQEAVAAGDRFREAATGLDLEAVTGSGRTGAGELLPFARRD